MSAAALDLAQQPQGTSADACVVRLPQLEQGWLGLLLPLVQGGPGEVTHRKVRVLQRPGRALCRLEIELRDLVLDAGRGDAEDAATVAVALGVAADPGIVPVGDEQ